jgi:Arc/MetJ-type ribon-helix-helix transcriptional regulator
VPSLIPATTLRLTDEDRAVLRELKDVTGLSSTSDVVRLALREMLSVRLAQAAVQQGRVRRGRR